MRFPLRSIVLVPAVAAVCALQPAHAQTSLSLHVDAGADRHAINPDIYGIVSYGLAPTFAAEIKVSNVRWGGDGTTRYNWQVDSSNSGADWYFTGGSGKSNPVPSASPDAMVSTFKAAGAQSLITIPIIPYVNKSSSWNCSFPVATYGPQQHTNPYVRSNGSDCGNSVTTTGEQLLDTSIHSNHIENSTALQMGWLQHLTGTFGPASAGGVQFYQLDNEPSGWSNTHRDVQPTIAPYQTIVSLGHQYAAAIKAVDPTALVLGPSDFTLGGWIGDTGKQNNLFAGQYYLQQMAALDRAQGRRTLDYFDEHYYPQFSNATEQLASSRTFWDTTYNGGTWVEQYAFNAPMQLIPRFKGWIAKYYPGTKLSFSEYSIDSGKKAIADALAEADVLGIFGREGVDFANMWNSPAPTDPIAFAFRLFRNYDGAGSQFGDTALQATSSDQSRIALYAAQRTTDRALTVLVLNKSAAAISAPLALANQSVSAQAAVYQYTGADLTRIVALPAVKVSSNSLQYSFPAFSATLFVLSPTTQASAPTSKPCVLNHSSSKRHCTSTPGKSASLEASAEEPSVSLSEKDGARSLVD